jgi:hypothetical protein
MRPINNELRRTQITAHYDITLAALRGNHKEGGDPSSQLSPSRRPQRLSTDICGSGGVTDHVHTGLIVASCRPRKYKSPSPL